MKDVWDVLISIAVLGGILVGSAVFTNLFVKVMYNRCGKCGTINAKRRVNCRSCGNRLKDGHA